MLRRILIIIHVNVRRRNDSLGQNNFNAFYVFCCLTCFHTRFCFGLRDFTRKNVQTKFHNRVCHLSIKEKVNVLILLKEFLSILGKLWVKQIYIEKKLKQEIELFYFQVTNSQNFLLEEEGVRERINTRHNGSKTIEDMLMVPTEL